MDAARRWQVVSLVTAVASLGGGALMIGHQSTEALPPIDLEIPSVLDRASDERRRIPRDPVQEPVGDEIVAPPIIEVESRRDPTVGPAGERTEPATPEPDEPRPDEPRPDEPRPDEPRPDEPRPDEPRTSVDPGSVDSPSSVDSD